VTLAWAVHSLASKWTRRTSTRKRTEVAFIAGWKPFVPFLMKRIDDRRLAV
jgi:hypothetical protein